MKTRLDLAVRPGTALRVLVVEGEGDQLEPASSSRVRVARLVGDDEDDEPTVPEFKDLHRWTKNAKLARGA